MNNTEYVALQRMVEALTARVEALEGIATRPPVSEMPAPPRGPGRPKSAAPQA